MPRAAAAAAALLLLAAAAARGVRAGVACAPGGGAATVVLSEVAAWTTPEWVELHNPTTATVDVGLWLLGDAERNVTLPAGLRLPAGGYLVLARDAEAFEALHGFLPSTGDLTLSLANAADSVALYGRDGALADSVSWSSSLPAGSTTARDGSSAAADTPAAWATAASPGTPGAGPLACPGEAPPAPGTACNNLVLDACAAGPARAPLRECLRRECFDALHCSLGYDDTARVRLFNDVDNTDGTLRMVYGGLEVAHPAGGDNITGLSERGVTAEHTVPQSLFRPEGGDTLARESMRGDLHALFPAHSSLNSARGNRRFGEFDDADTERFYHGAGTQYPTLAAAEASGVPLGEMSRLSRGGLWMPPVAQRGAAARAALYMYAVYEAEMLDARADGQAGTLDDVFAGGAAAALAWHAQYPPGAAEVARSERAAVAQGNPNPFVARPSLAQPAFAECEVDADCDGGGTFCAPRRCDAGLCAAGEAPCGGAFEACNETLSRCVAPACASAGVGGECWDGRADTVGERCTALQQCRGDEVEAGRHLLLSEVAYDVDVEPHGEWVELYNPADEAVPLAGWTLGDNVGTFALPDGLVLPPRSFLLVGGPLAPPCVDGAGAGAARVTNMTLQLSNKGDLVVLRDPAGRAMDHVAWGGAATAPFPAWSLSAGNGATLHRPAPVDTDTPADWTASGAGSPCGGFGCTDDAGCGSTFCEPAECRAGVCLPLPGPCGDGELCSAARGACVECEETPDCGDGSFCRLPACGADGTCSEAARDCGAGLVCDDARGRCAECAGDADCAGTFCGPAVCTANGTCGAAPSPCGGGTPVCDAAGERCVECAADADCDDGVHCNGAETCAAAAGTCVAPVAPPACGPAAPLCSNELAACVECLGAADCDGGGAAADPCAPVACSALGECAAAPPPCNATRGEQCVAGECFLCVDDGVCRAGETCGVCADCGEAAPRACDYDGVCDGGAGENCATCPHDCASRLEGPKRARFCCGGAAGDAAGGRDDPAYLVPCSDERCGACTLGNRTASGTQCCGDGRCDAPEEDAAGCPADCAADPPAPEPPAASCRATEALREVSCADGLDNDCDGVSDFDDADCAGCASGGVECARGGECCSGVCGSAGACNGAAVVTLRARATDEDLGAGAAAWRDALERAVAGATGADPLDVQVLRARREGTAHALVDVALLAGAGGAPGNSSEAAAAARGLEEAVRGGGLAAAGVEGSGGFVGVRGSGAGPGDDSSGFTTAAALSVAFCALVLAALGVTWAYQTRARRRKAAAARSKKYRAASSDRRPLSRRAGMAKSSSRSAGGLNAAA